MVLWKLAILELWGRESQAGAGRGVPGERAAARKRHPAGAFAVPRQDDYNAALLSGLN